MLAWLGLLQVMAGFACGRKVLNLPSTYISGYLLPFTIEVLVAVNFQPGHVLSYRFGRLVRCYNL